MSDKIIHIIAPVFINVFRNKATDFTWSLEETPQTEIEIRQKPSSSKPGENVVEVKLISDSKIKQIAEISPLDTCHVILTRKIKEKFGKVEDGDIVYIKF